MVRDKLERRIHNLVMETGREPNVIVMHPQTWADLIKEVTGEYVIPNDNYDSNMKYGGVKVLRSLDLTEGEFEVYF